MFAVLAILVADDVCGMSAMVGKLLLLRVLKWPVRSAGEVMQSQEALNCFSNQASVASCT
jgi:hypothetical protein